jgi:hypothetical protein
VPKYHIYQETTEWNDSNGANHIYVFSDKPSGRTATAIGYIPTGTTKVFKFRTPLKLDLKGRTFRPLA